MAAKDVRPATGGVQSVERAFALLESLADAGGSQSLTEMAGVSGLPLPTIHRLMSTMASLGYVRRESTRGYALGPRLVQLGEAANRAYGVLAGASLRKLAQATGETANLAMLDGDAVLYVAQAPSPHAMRMFTEPGRRVLPHCTGVGKALMAQMSSEDARALLLRTGMPARTEHTITDVDAMLAELETVRANGYAVDDNEQEVGVRCVAVPVRRAPGLVAISVSGPEARIGHEQIIRMVPVLNAAAEELGTAAM